MKALSGAHRIWSGARSSPQDHPVPPTAARLRAVGGRIGLVTPSRSTAPGEDEVDAIEDRDVNDADGHV